MAENRFGINRREFITVAGTAAVNTGIRPKIDPMWSKRCSKT